MYGTHQSLCVNTMVCQIREHLNSNTHRAHVSRPQEYREKAAKTGAWHTSSSVIMHPHNNTTRGMPRPSPATYSLHS